MDTDFDRQRLQEILFRLVEEEESSWLLIGGALVALWLDSRRTTQDLDLVGLGGKPSERYDLMRFAARSGLPVEALNSAADFFVREIDGWEGDMEVFVEGRKGIVYRPTPTLFVLLKAGRLSSQDLDDILAMIDHARTHGLYLDVPRILTWLGERPIPEGTDLGLRRQRLAGALRLAAD